MNKLKIFLITLIILMLGLLTAGISLYALNPDFSAFVNSRLKNENRTSDEVPAAPTPSEATETEEAKKDAASDGVAEALPIGYGLDGASINEPEYNRYQKLVTTSRLSW